MIDYLRLCNAFENYKQTVDELNKLFSEVESFVAEKQIRTSFTYDIKENDDLFQIIYDKFNEKKERRILFYFKHPDNLEITKKVWAESPLVIRIIAARYLQEFIDAYANFLQNLIIKFKND